MQVPPLQPEDAGLLVTDAAIDAAGNSPPPR